METVEILGCRAKVAHTFCERARGLIGVKGLAPGEGMLIERCNAIHTFFMSFSIDASEDRQEHTPVASARLGRMACEEGSRDGSAHSALRLICAWEQVLVKSTQQEDMR